MDFIESFRQSKRTKLTVVSLVGVAFDDDKQVAFVTAYKRWAGEARKPGICVQFWEME